MPFTSKYQCMLRRALLKRSTMGLFTFKSQSVIIRILLVAWITYIWWEHWHSYNFIYVLPFLDLIRLKTFCSSNFVILLLKFLIFGLEFLLLVTRYLIFIPLVWYLKRIMRNTNVSTILDNHLMNFQVNMIDSKIFSYSKYPDRSTIDHLRLETS